ncbi:MAG: protein-L-isoaspartate O-methyltransferase [Actinobacteria bacterium]|nr:MAG: protein-L-isoaspartate O-methyltransferase [Actinomycetota bacterium]
MARLFSRNDPDRARQQMVDGQLAARDIDDPRVLAAMATVPRHLFVPPELAASAYEDRPLPIGRDQTISQPYIVAYTVQAMRLGASDRVLEVGTGSGYAAAVLAELCAEVVTIECISSLAESAGERLARLGYGNVTVIEGDGGMGRPSDAPFDAIAVAAAGPSIPDALVDQLSAGGRLVMPVGRRRGGQHLVRAVRTAGGTEVEALLPVTFVPLTGAAAQ